MEKVSEINFDKLRQIGDPPADAFVSIYFAEPSKKMKLDEAFKNLKFNKDWPAFLLTIPEASFFDEELEKIIPPEKRDISKAQSFYKDKEQFILQLLGLLSLPYCYAAADGAKVLYQTERMYKDVETRLKETAEFVTTVMHQNAFTAEGSARVQIFKVRVMHAAARFYLQKSNWDATLGVPVNQEDMAGTNLSFSLIVIRGLRKMGFTIGHPEQLAYLKYWNYVGAMLGLKTVLVPPDGKFAREIDQQISERQFRPSTEGKALTKSLLNCFYNLNDEKLISNKEIAAYMRFLLGPEISDILDLPKGEFPTSKRMLLQIKNSFS